MVSVTYAFGGTLGGDGIGRIAGHAAAGASRASLLEQAIVYDVDAPGVPDAFVTTVPLGRYLKRIPNYFLKDTAFDRLCARVVDAPDVFHGWNNMCLQSMRRAAEHGAATVVERASSHPTVQRRLVEREYREFGVERSPTYERLYRRALQELEEADRIFVPSTFVSDSFREQGFEESKLVEIPFGVDTDQFRPSADAHRDEAVDDETDDSLQLLFVGQVSLRKGIQYLLPAWQRADVDGELRLAGQPTEGGKAILERYADDPSITPTGWIDDMVAEYQAADLFVFPSVEEGSALVSYEAMACGLPSIVTPNVGSLVEHEKHGLVVEPRDVSSLADAIERLAASPAERRSFGRAARETVEDYTWERYGDRVAAAYRSLLAA